MNIENYLTAHADQSTADAVAGYNAMPPVTVRPIPLADLAALLRKSGLMAILKGAAASEQTPSPIRVGLADFLDQLADVRANNLDTTDPIIASRAAATLAGLAAVGMLDAGGANAIYALGGGLVRSSAVTESDVTHARAAIARRADVVPIRAAVMSYLNDVLATAEADATLPLVTPAQQFGGG